ncbi:MAG: pseudouridine synthase [Gammaproteobacteria bacterium]
MDRRGVREHARQRSGHAADFFTSSEGQERVQKLLARVGLGSRRALERWIEAGRVTVNGRIAHLGDSASARDRIRIDGKLLPRGLLYTQAVRVLAYHKPAGLVCSRVRQSGCASVYEQLPPLPGGRWLGIGRLDIDTSGLMLFTNSGELAYRLMHPTRRIEREYAVRVWGEVNDQAVQQLLVGIELTEGAARFEAIRFAGGAGRNQWFHCVLGEGRNREVRRLWGSQGCTVSRLIRVRYGPIALDKALRRSRYRELSADEVAKLLMLAGLKVQRSNNGGREKGG